MAVATAHDVGRDLLERDPTSPQRGGQDEIKASPSEIPGERGRKREDGPQAGDQGEHPRVVPREKPSQRGHVHGVAVHDPHSLGDLRGIVGHLGPGSGRAVGSGHGASAGQEGQAHESGHACSAQARVPERLGVHAAEPEQAAGERHAAGRSRRAAGDCVHGSCSPMARLPQLGPVRERGLRRSNPQEVIDGRVGR